MRRAGLVCVVVALAGCQAGRPDPANDGHELADALAGRTPGKPVSCIDNTQTSTQRIVAPDTILYSSTGRTLYRTTVQGCTALRPFSTIISIQYGSQLCRNDLFRVREPGLFIPSAYCRFGEFVPYTKVEQR